MIHEIYMSPCKKAALKAFDDFVELFETKYPKATNCLLKDKDQMLAFYDFPAEHIVTDAYPFHKCHRIYLLHRPFEDLQNQRVPFKKDGFNNGI